MMRITIAAAALVAAVATAGGCGGGNEAKCKKAVENIFSITGLDKTGSGPDIHAAVRSCRANASDDAIECMIAAKTLADLEKCEGGVADDIVKGKDDSKEKTDE